MHILTVPNLLTLVRLILAPFAMRAIAAGRFREALVLLAVAGVTDGLDGYLARRFHWTSRFGAYLDPVADKVLLSGCYLALGIAAAAPWWLVGIVFGRDVLILLLVGAALLFTDCRDFPPSVWGKISTAIQVFCGISLIVARAFPALGLPAALFVWAVAAGTLWSGADYLRRAVRRIDGTAIRA